MNTDPYNPTDAELRAAQAFSVYMQNLWHGDSTHAKSCCPVDPHAAAEFQQAVRGLDKTIGGDLPMPAVDNYRALRCLGHGGMGVVYEAEQLTPKRRVALKIIKCLCRPDDYQARLFDREIQALARLKHTSVAAIYESGLTRSGQPYYAMELVTGTPLLDYVHSHRLDTHARLRLFLELCKGMHYAHQRGVIHRDLKPSNILVDDSGQPKILDFGLAKLTSSSDETMTISDGQGICGTLPYMSPEQLCGDQQEVDVQSDVYSLGVILYEVLTSQLPFDVRQQALPKIAQLLSEQSPPRPSFYNKLLKGDLDAICLRALQYDRRRRYVNVAALEDDIARHLDNLPISAAEPSAAYHVGKFIKRRKLPCTIAASLLFALCTTTIITTVQARQTAQQRDAAILAEHQMKAANDRLLGLFLLASPRNEGPQFTLLSALDSYSDNLHEYYADQPKIEAMFHRRIGALYSQLRKPLSAVRHFSAAVALDRQLNDHESLRAAHTQLNLSRSFRQAGRFADAIHMASIARDTMVRRRANDRDLSVAVAELGRAHTAFGNYSEAHALLQNAVDLRASLPNKKSEDSRIRLSLSRTLNKMGLYDRAEAHAQAVLDSLQASSDPLLAAEAHALLSRALLGQYKLHDAAEHAVISIRRSDEVGGSVPVNSKTRVLYARILLALDEPSLALSQAQLAMGVYRRLPKKHPMVSKTQHVMGMALMALGEYADAEPLLRDGLNGRLETFRPGRQIAMSQLGLGQCLYELGRTEEARCLMDSALPELLRLSHADHAQLAIAARSNTNDPIK